MSYLRYSLPPGHLEGLDVDRTGNGTCKIDVGSCRDEDDLGDIHATTPLTANLGASGANGLDSGAESADKWYSLWVIGKPDGTVASLWSTATAKSGLTLPTGYAYARKVAWWRNGSSGNLWAGEMGGKGRLRQQWHDMPDPPIEVLSGGSATSFTPVSLVGQVPPESVVAFIRAQVGGGNYGVIRPNSSFSSLTAVLKIVSGTSQSGLLLAKDREIEYAVNAGTESVAIWCYGWQHTF